VWTRTVLGASQATSRFSGNPRVHNHVHESPPLVPILSHISPFLTVRSILILSSYISYAFQVGSFVQSSARMHLSSLPYMLHAPPIPYFLILSLNIGEGCKSWSLLVSNLLRSPVTSLLRPHKSSTPFSDTPLSDDLHRPNFSPIHNNQWPNNRVSSYARKDLAHVVGAGEAIFRIYTVSSTSQTVGCSHMPTSARTIFLYPLGALL